MSKIDLKIQTPSVPNFVRLEMPGTAQKQDGFKEAPMISIGDLTDEQLEGLASDWRKELIAKALKMREK